MSRQPLIQVSSRGGRYAFRKNTLKRWANTAPTMRFAAHACTERMSQPKGTCATMKRTLSNADSGAGR